MFVNDVVYDRDKVSSDTRVEIINMYIICGFV